MPTAGLSERRSFQPTRQDTADPGLDRTQLERALAQWTAADGRPRVLVDDALRLHWVSPSARRLMSGPNSLLIRNGHLRTRNNRFDRQLRELIDRATPQMSSCCIHAPEANEHLVVTALRLGAPCEDLVGLSLQRATEDFPFRLADLHAAFGLTLTEERVAHRLMSGRTAEETAQELGVSLETVRTHIKRAYAKLGVGSREAFFHRLTPFVILLA